MKNIFAILIIIAAVGIFFLYVKPGYSAIKVSQQELSSYQDTLDQAEQLEQLISKLQDRRKSFNPDEMAKLEKLIPDTVSNVNLIIDVNTIASNVGLSIRNIDLTLPAETEGSDQQIYQSDNGLYDSIDLSFEVTATYQGFLTFISSLEKSLRLVDITNISFTPKDNSNVYDFKVTVRTYWLK